MAAIRFSPFTCCFRRFSRRSCTVSSTTRTPNSHDHSCLHCSHTVNSRADGSFITPITYTYSLRSREYWPLSTWSNGEAIRVRQIMVSGRMVCTSSRLSRHWCPKASYNAFNTRGSLIRNARLCACRAELKGTNYMGQTGFHENLRFPAVFCDNLRFPAVFCENLRLRNAWGKATICKNQRKTANLAPFILFCSPWASATDTPPVDSGHLSKYVHGGMWWSATCYATVIAVAEQWSATLWACLHPICCTTPFAKLTLWPSSCLSPTRFLNFWE